MLPSKLVFQDRLPSYGKLAKAHPDRKIVLIYDQILGRLEPQFVSQFGLSFPLRSGEKIKSLAFLKKFLEKLVKKTAGEKLVFVGFGGGTIGDFTGFVASIYQRGCPLIHIPSTWLAALDSSHGGKTGINVFSYKNQIGSYWPADSTFLVKALLCKQPEKRIQDVKGELIKTSLLRGDSLWKNDRHLKNPRALWHYLPEAIRYKYSIVKKDPFEKKGLRQILNFGHTIGHVLELQEGLPHGEAVRLGICFDLNWSYHRGLITSLQLKEFQKCDWWVSAQDLAKTLRRIKNFSALLSRDKKRIATTIRYTLLRGPGKSLLLNLPLSEVVSEYRRQSGGEA